MNTTANSNSSSKLPRLTSKLTFQNNPRLLTEEAELDDEDSIINNIPNIEELASKFNYQGHFQPFEFGADRDLDLIVHQLKLKKKSS